MSRLPGRALAAVALAALLAGCGGTGATTGSSASRPSTSATPPPAAKSVPTVGRSVPVGLRIPAIGVDTPVMKLGLAGDGSVQVPPIAAHDRAGWYEHSPTPGQTGPSVILGHVTVGAYGDGVFRHLADLEQGARIEVRLANGKAAEFAVTRVETVAKAEFPTGEVYGNVDRPELRLITCGGPRTGDGYQDNVIVFATLGSAAAKH
ncbi:class F sortase [Streptomyces cylindrosporus]|uniref:Class F sortase n=1 Tax=Streptomyces cylindrosporus TaxID=2927583 RepID=A0ABS9YPQ3_9ACTN|nr:class F sortase [Streptomyces cylindrosporus]MCI3277816.1 class F sortase [Streptomyces cylindrosporus]